MGFNVEIENLILPEGQDLTLEHLLIIRHSLATTLVQIDQKIAELQACQPESDSLDSQI